MNIIITFIFGVIGLLLITGLSFSIIIFLVVIWGVVLNLFPFIRRFLSDYLKLSDDDIAFLPVFGLIIYSAITLIF